MSERIGVIAAELPPAPGGVQRFSQGVIDQLVDRGRNLVVVTTADHPGENGVSAPLHRVLSQSRRHDIPALKQIQNDERLTSWLVMSAGYAWVASDFPQIPTDVFAHGNDFALPYPLCARPLLAGLWPPGKISRLEFALSRVLTRRLISAGFLASRKLFANSRYTAAQLHRLYPATRNRKITATGVGLDEAFLHCENSPPPEPHSALELLTVCRLDRGRKNVRSVIHAVEALLRDGHSIRYTIVGGGNELEQLRHEVASRSLSDQVHLPGRVSEQALLAAYRKANLFVMTPTADKSDFEGFGIVYLEANSFGLPVIASSIGGCGEAVREGETGLLVDDPNPGAIADTIRTFLSHRQDFTPAACKRFASAFSWNSVVDAIENGIDHPML